MCTLKKSKHRIPWLVQLAIGTRRKVSGVVMKCPLVMEGLATYAGLNVLPHGSYDVLIGMDWLEVQRKQLDCYNKTFEVLGGKGNLRVLKGFQKSDLWKVVFNKIVEEVLWEMFQSVCKSVLEVA